MSQLGQSGRCLFRNCVVSAHSFRAIGFGEHGVRKSHCSAGTGPLGGDRLVMESAKAEDTEEIFRLVIEHHYALAPNRQIMFFDRSDEHRRPADRLADIQFRLSQPYSLVIRDSLAGSRIVGVSLNKLESRKDLQHSGTSGPDRPVGWLTKALVAELYRGVDLFGRYQTDRILDLGSGVVRPEYRRSGLLLRMQKVATDLAHRDGAGAVKAYALRESGAKFITGQLGLELIKTVDYATFEYPPGVRSLANMLDQLGGSRAARLAAGRLPLRVFSVM